MEYCDIMLENPASETETESIGIGDGEIAFSTIRLSAVFTIDIWCFEFTE